MKQKISPKAIKIFTGVIVSIIIFGCTPPQAHATVPVWDVGAFGSIPPLIIARSAPPGSQHSKESSIVSLTYDQIIDAIIPSWDGVVNTLAKELIQEIKRETIDWIKNGFEGKPLFLQDPQKFFTNFGDQASAVFIQDIANEVGVDPGFFCNPNFGLQFSLDIGTAGRGSYFGQYGRGRCTISQVVNNVDSFYEDFSNGDWKALIMAQQSNNNPMGSYMQALLEETRIREEAEGFYDKVTQYGGGYLPTVECASRNSAGCRSFSIKTPSKAIADRVTHSVGLDFGELMSADEVSEVIATLLDLAIREGIKSFMDWSS
ncbi:MAG: hypothetical protein AAB482_00985 [Patescibacteria group bacterium]